MTHYIYKYSMLALMLLMAPSVAAKRKTEGHTIKAVEAVNVTSPQGCAPRLPWQLMVSYADGTKAWRQVRWTNQALATEQQQAQHQVGDTYTVSGYITGDQTTTSGYPVTANVPVTSDPWATPAPQPKAQPLPPYCVRLVGNNRLTSNRDLDIATILSWDVAQQLYNYRDTYGLPTDGYPKADGWDSPTTKLKGHGSGHYMSALAFAFLSATDSRQQQELYNRVERMVSELRQCQERTFVWSDSLGRYFEARDYAPEDQLRQMKGNWEAFDSYKKDYRHYGYGYLNAIPAAHPALIECYRAYNNEEWVWAPYYTIHKQLAGLIDIANAMQQYTDADPLHTLIGTTQQMQPAEVGAKALLIAKDMGLWVWNRLHYRTYVHTSGTKAERQARPGNRYEMWNMYIAGEVGGMAESLARLSEMVDAPADKARLLEASNYFDAPAFFDPLAHNIDDIRTRHANQHIPMITGALRSYRSNAQPQYYHLAYNFWHMVMGRYMYAMGGVGNGEMFRQPYTQILSMNTNVQSDYERNMHPNPDINETCCAYNLAKLTRELNGYDPDDAAYMDYYERVLYNQIVGSLHPTHYGCTYQYAVGMNARKPFGNETPQSTGCGGTGAENHVRYQEAAYYVSDSTLWVALYLPTEAVWSDKKVVVSQQCEWPAERSVITVSEGGRAFAMKLRVPYWATEGFDIRLNGQSVSSSYRPSSYVEIPRRTWSATDTIEVVMPFTKHIHWGPDKMDIAATGKNQTQTTFTPQWVGALMYGPLVMATSDVRSWQEADVRLSSDLREVTPLGASADAGTNGHLYAMTLQSGDRTLSFTPDYYQTDHATHYLRLDMADTRGKTSKRGGADLQPLQSLLRMAHERQQAQQAWEALSEKVPAYAPWAPHGYARMQQAVAEADKVVTRGARASQQQADEALTALNAALNTMRPGNLAEPEALAPLLTLLAEVRQHQDPSDAQREAIAYADMVVQYVNQGSGTKDLIDKAIERLQTINNK